MLAEVQYILLHTIALPGDSAPISDLLACLLWPMIHLKRDHFGKPVKVRCNSVFEPEAVNMFWLYSFYIQYLLVLLLVLNVVNAYELQYFLSNEKPSMIVL